MYPVALDLLRLLLNDAHVLTYWCIEFSQWLETFGFLVTQTLPQSNSWHGGQLYQAKHVRMRGLENVHRMKGTGFYDLIWKWPHVTFTIVHLPGACCKASSILKATGVTQRQEAETAKDHSTCNWGRSVLTALVPCSWLFITCVKKHVCE
jgi:hypothetical protein